MTDPPLPLSPPPLSERELTDESLRAERELVDRALEEGLAGADETADAIVSLARRRADALLAATRTGADAPGPAHQVPERLRDSRALEDQLVERERRVADLVLREERAGHAGLLSQERGDTDKDLSNERLRADHALAMRDEFLGIVSHDLLNMLNAVMGVASIIEKEVVRDDHAERVIAHARRIRRSGARMQRLIGDLVDVASIEAGRLAVACEVGDPALLVNEAVEMFQAQASASGISLVADVILPLPPVAFDPARMLQVLTNLLSNALKFTEAGGTVTVRVETVGGHVRFAVSDTGEGIPADKLEAVFDRFVQLTMNDRRGVGLGLYISRCIVEGHAGRMWAESNADKGSTFCFALPAQVAGDSAETAE